MITENDIGKLVTVTDGTPKPPARFNRKLAEWETRNFTGKLIKVYEGWSDLPSTAGRTFADIEVTNLGWIVVVKSGIDVNRVSLAPKPVYTFYNDPGHGWLEVPIAELKRLGIYNSISPYSYVKGDMAYLEEDLDASTFYNTCKQQGVEYDHVSKYQENTPIRGYASFPSHPQWDSNSGWKKTAEAIK